MPNNFTVIGLGGRDWTRTEDPYTIDRSPLNKANLCDLVDPMPAECKGDAAYLDFAREHWGTQGGTYDTKVHELSGDGSPILIEFQCAWGPPNAETMRKIDDYLCREYHMKSITWTGHNPYDNSTGPISIAASADQITDDELAC